MGDDKLQEGNKILKKLLKKVAFDRPLGLRCRIPAPAERLQGEAILFFTGAEPIKNMETWER
ncbi:hypothetical protein ACSAZK_07275 [Methanosarcina sp. Mfa9]|uniref:hypothetical protein n=1 Tax=Methanosarcina sp. Mfa9 TaxID=3439063 RepID=UPI003F832A7B